MHITVINPNTTRAMTDMIGSCARGVAGPGTRISAVNPSMGPASIESHYDEALSVPGVLHEIAEGERAGSDGYVIACFGDPGLDAARELAGGPVVGIAEAAMHAATLVGRSFSVVTSLSRTVGRAHDLVRHYGFADRCVGVYACDIPVLALDDPSTGAARVIIELCRQTVERDKADSIVLGCAGMADLCSYVSQEVGVPVIDGVSAATKLVESLVTLGYSTSRRDEFARPLPKAYVGGLSAFELVD
ncbi:allantoin racemase [Agreia bicolorata]|uniref:Hydantoin racemase n=1 Tax=Agreia bicolorata TaxID=110935 RepID=A0A1T4YGI0_9MICO|nr:aspartate/glutamate racemase family protein [Agreia bicolorata]SKB00942.1 allantoin racemase [Agreia bicolorata]